MACTGAAARSCRTRWSLLAGSDVLAVTAAGRRPQQQQHSNLATNARELGWVRTRTAAQNGRFRCLGSMTSTELRR